MVAANPVFRKWSLKKLNATVMNDIWPEILFFVAVSVMVCCLNEYTTSKVYISNQMLTVLGTVLGLVISFRTTSAYDRFWEGRKLWGTIMLQSRNLGQIIWIHVPLDRKFKDANNNNLPVEKDARLRSILERKSMLNLVQGFSVAVKHYLRSEPGIYYEDLYPLVSMLPHDLSGDISGERNTTGPDALPLWQETNLPKMKLRKTNSDPTAGQKHDSYDPEKGLAHIHSDVPLRPARNPPRESILDYLPILFIFKPAFNMVKRLFKKEEPQELVGGAQRNFFGKKVQAIPIDSNVPLEIVLFLSSYLQMLLRNGFLQPAIATAYVNSITSLQDCVANLERIRTTPIPFAYQTHLRMSVWLYLLFLPFEIYQAFKWLTIPATAFAAFLYIGFLEIGQEIENPFNYDANDLDLDTFCLTIQRELAEIAAHPALDPTSFIFSQWNQPFAPGDRRTAQDILAHVDHDYHSEDAGIDSVRRTMLKSYKEVSEVTHQSQAKLAW
jgi:predicted membrane chloride channel (bestrophin family)